LVRRGVRGWRDHTKSRGGEWWGKGRGCIEKKVKQPFRKGKIKK